MGESPKSPHKRKKPAALMQPPETSEKQALPISVFGETLTAMDDLDLWDDSLERSNDQNIEAYYQFTNTVNTPLDPSGCAPFFQNAVRALRTAPASAIELQVLLRRKSESMEILSKSLGSQFLPDPVLPTVLSNLFRVVTSAVDLLCKIGITIGVETQPIKLAASEMIAFIRQCPDLWKHSRERADWPMIIPIIGTHLDSEAKTRLLTVAAKCDVAIDMIRETLLLRAANASPSGQPPSPEHAPEEWHQWVYTKQVRKWFETKGHITSKSGWSAFASRMKNEGRIIDHPQSGPKKLRLHRSVFNQYSEDMPDLTKSQD